MFANKNHWIGTLVQLCFLKVSPEALPYARGLTWGGTLAIVGLPILMFLFGPQDSVHFVYVLYALNTLAYLLCFYALLRFRRVESRLTKLWLAIMGSSLLIGLASTLLMMIAPAPLRSVLFMLSTSWGFMVTMHIYSLGLEISRIFSVALILIVQFLAMLLSVLFLTVLLGGDATVVEQFLTKQSAALVPE